MLRGGVAQLVERRDHNPLVGGSSPFSAMPFLAIMVKIIHKTPLKCLFWSFCTFLY